MTFRPTPRPGFSTKTLRRRRQPHAFSYLKEKMTFWIAVLSIFAFVAGNMVGKLGWYGFWASVRGELDHTAYEYNGAELPVGKVPDYSRWSLYGGNADAHTAREVPLDLWVPLPGYIPASQRSKDDMLRNLVYSVDFMGRYSDPLGGGEGSHQGIDIRVPEGTRVNAAMRGVVVRAAEEPGGYGKYVTLRHHAPDPDDAAHLIDVYSTYSHLSAILVGKGMIVQKGEQIGLSGRTGNASGPHLHFQMQRNVESHWPFTYKDLQAAHMTFAQAIDAGLNREEAMKVAINPMAYVQANYSVVGTAIAQASSSSDRRRAPTRGERIAARLKRMQEGQANVAVVEQKLVSIAESLPPPPAASRTVARAEFDLPSSHVGRKWVSVTVHLYDAEGRQVVDPDLPFDLRLAAAFGKAQFRPEKLSALDFRGDGTATFEVLPLEKRTLVIGAGDFQAPPMRYEAQ